MERDLPDAELIAGFRTSGDARCFRGLYKRHRKRVFAVALHYLGDRSDAEDVCHDAFVRAFEHFPSLRGEFGPWVRRIAANLAINLLRDRHTQRRLLACNRQQDTAPAADHQAHSEQALQEALAIIATLKSAQKQCLVLRQIDGLGYKEIACHTGMSLNEVRSHLQNARRNFNQAWNQRHGASIDG